MRGRTPVGPELAEQLDGSEQARERMRVILQTLAGTMRVSEACAEFGICQQRFETIRTEAIQAGIEALEVKPAGRPARVEPENQEELNRLEELEVELEAALVRVELAGSLPRVGGEVAKKSSPRSSHAKESHRLRPGNSKKSKPMKKSKKPKSKK